MTTYRGADSVNSGVTVATASEIADAITWSEEWAIKAEDSLVSAAAGGNETTDYSSLHWAAKSSASATAAQTAQTAAETAQTAAELAEANASTSETNAASSETNAETSETNAATSETNSAANAAAALASENAAALSASNAATSETNAAASAAAALVSENNAADTLAAAFLKDGTRPMEANIDMGTYAITNVGNVDGRDVAADGTKLDGIESGATADQTAADIRGLGFFDTSNDGAGSGLDADLLDGYQASAFPRKAENATISGTWDFASKITSGGIEVGHGATQGIFFEGGKHQITNNDGGGNFNIRIGNHFTNGITEAGYAAHIAYDQGVGLYSFNNTTASQTVGQTPVWNSLLAMSNSTFTYKNNTIWHSGNDGPGSGLNADLLDGENLVDGADTANTVVGRNSAGDIYARLFKSTYAEQTSAPASTADVCFRVNNSTDNYLRFVSRTGFQSYIEPDLDADLLDGAHGNTAHNDFTGNEYVRRDTNGYIFAPFFNQTGATTATPTNAIVMIGSDNYMRWANFSTFYKSINGLTADASPVGSTDYVVTYDASAGTGKKVLLDDLPAGQTAKVWWSMNTAFTLLDSFNVTSVTDNGTGDATINFTTAMADTNYAWVLSATTSGTIAWTGSHLQSKSTTNIRVYVSANSNTYDSYQDYANSGVIFGDQ